jgi:VCBS repeat-containing protein
MRKALHAFVMVVFLVVIFVQAPQPVQAATNKAPTANAQSVVTNEDTSLLITFTGSDPEGSALTYTVTTNPSKGTLSACSANHCLYTPKSNLNGSDSLAFKVSDGSLTSKAAARVTITVNAVNDAPTIQPFDYTFNEDSPLTFLPKKADIDGDATSVAIATQPSHGTVATSGSDAVVYTPSTNYFGTDNFTISSYDGKTYSTPATVSLTINAINDAPTVADQMVNGLEDTALVIPLAANDVDSPNLTVAFGYPATHGGVSVAGTTLTYTPNAEYSGSDSLTYRVTDGVTWSSTATVSITMDAVNDAPIAYDAELTVMAGTSAVTPLIATDAEGSALTSVIVIAPTMGTAEIVGDYIVYTANVDANGDDDGRGSDLLSATAKASSQTWVRYGFTIKQEVRLYQLI